MAITMTLHGWRPREDGGAKVEALAGQTGDAITVADGAVSDALTVSGLYRIKATSACTVRIGDANLADASDGELWDEGEKEVRYLAAGQKIAVDAA